MINSYSVYLEFKHKCFKKWTRIASYEILFNNIVLVPDGHIAEFLTL